MQVLITSKELGYMNQSKASVSHLVLTSLAIEAIYNINVTATNEVGDSNVFSSNFTTSCK